RLFSIVFSTLTAFLAAILTFESPYDLIRQLGIGNQVLIPADGNGMAPSLLNYWVVIHPPTIFFGFGSMAILFAWSMAALMKRDLETWIDQVRPWALVSLSLLGLGLCMGGFWAYETLGWGGFWMWDPVENTSFVPWCALAAFIHGIFVQKSRTKWHLGNTIWAALPFILFCYGTFLTRSGMLGDTSVHSFAQMDRSALWLLITLGGAALGSFIVVHLWNRAAIRKMLGQGVESKGWLQREAFYGSAIWLLTSLGVVTAIGMSVPLIQSLMNRTPKVVEEHLYHQVLAWPFPFIMIFMGIAPFLTWKHIGFKALMGRLANALAISIGITGCLLIWVKQGYTGVPADLEKTIHFFGEVHAVGWVWVSILCFFCTFTCVANLYRMAELAKRSPSGLGGMVTHIGVALTMFGLIASRGFEQKQEMIVHSAAPASAFGYQVSLIGNNKPFTDRNNKIEMKVDTGNYTFTARPGLYFMPDPQGGEPSPFIWPHVEHRFLYDIYMTAHPFQFEATDPTPLKPGETGVYRERGIAVTYAQLRTDGPMGMVGATFIADARVRIGSEEFVVSPSIKMVGAGDLQYNDAKLGDHYTLRLERIDAADRTAYFQVLYANPAYPVEVFYKPLTGFVWFGTAIMTIGGLWAAWYRRRSRQEPLQGLPAEDEKGIEQSKESEDAPVPVAKI
ncbi:MAG: cytochrome c biogenesis protein CcsA, partial [Fimbriimonadaceae bacterium]|nr:cytochrome c biogenesis protein CcsA [Fimbriimonadaceae bacterium]